MSAKKTAGGKSSGKKAAAKKAEKQLSFEEKIWEAACILWGNIDAAEYRNVVLGLIFLKYISDKFEAQHAKLLTEEFADPEDKDEYTKDNVFFVPPSARWDCIAKSSGSSSVGTAIDNAMALIEAENPSLKGILPKNFGRPELKKEVLGQVVDVFTNVSMHAEEGHGDLLGRSYEYCLSKFAEAEGKKGGEYYTPACIVRTIVEILEPYHGRIYDPACGSGGMFVQSAKFLASHSGSLKDISVFGQEANSTTWKLAKMNLAIRGISANLGPHAADSFREDLHPTLKAEFVMANPPFNLSKWGADALQGDKRWKYGSPTDGNANYAWIQHMIHHLSPKGKIGLVLANGSLTSGTNGEGEMRAAMVDDDLVECIIAMPTNLFYTVTIPVCVWIFNKAKKQKNKTLFIDARNLGEMVNRKHRDFSDADIAKLTQCYKDFCAGTLTDEQGFCAQVSTEEIKKQSYMLTPGRYVGIADEEEDPEPYAEKMQRLTQELSQLFSTGHTLEEQIKQQLKGIGYEL